MNPRVAMVGKGFAKYMRRSPMSDAEITQALNWIREEIDGILNGREPIALPTMESDTEPLFDLSQFEPAEDSRLIPADELDLLTGERL